MDYKKYLIGHNNTIKRALELLSKVGIETILFAVNENQQLKGSITDGDIRRGLLKGLSLDDEIKGVIHLEAKYIRKENYSIDEVINLRDNNFKVVPIIDKDDVILNIINFCLIKSYLPIDVVVMAGGLGSRLKPLTNNTPKPLLKVGNKTIIDHNIDRLRKFGVDNFWISVSYLGGQIENHFGNGKSRNVKIEYIHENRPLGTIGAISQVNNFSHDYVLVTNSDILTNLDYEDFFIDFIKKEADMSVVTIPYEVDIPYAVLENENGNIVSFKEKPTYTYYSNGGIYLIKKEALDCIPKDEFFNATDLIEYLINENKKVISYPLVGYWLDIGKHEDFEKAQKDINQIKF